MALAHDFASLIENALAAQLESTLFTVDGTSGWHAESAIIKAEAEMEYRKSRIARRGFLVGKATLHRRTDCLTCNDACKVRRVERPMYSAAESTSS